MVNTDSVITVLQGCLKEQFETWIVPVAGAVASHHTQGARGVKQAAKGERYHFHSNSNANVPSCPRSPGKLKSIDGLKKGNELILFRKCLLSGARCH